ncbi:MAG: N-acetylmuramic acid 6-phosphate etherase [Verrucomicrobiota bacterium]|nr:N-acetylmuramic acid 6-phosphate etherase [Verrucomicrobiota bacterium]
MSIPPELSKLPAPTSSAVFLGIEAGGTQTIALLADEHLRLGERLELGPANLQLSSDEALLKLFGSIRERLGTPQGIGCGFPGLRTRADEERVGKLLETVWPGIPRAISNDLETALHAAEPEAADCAGTVLVLSGTGSCCYGRNRKGRISKIGGWGHILGDKGSGYEIGLRGVKASLHSLDRDGKLPPLGRRILRELLLNEPNELIQWALHAPKQEIASLAKLVFSAAEKKEKIACDILDGAASSLCKDALACAGKLVRDGVPLRFLFSGSVLLKNDSFSAQVRRLLEEKRPGSTIELLTRESAWGAVRLARKVARPFSSSRRVEKRGPQWPMPVATGMSPTEERNPRSMNLDQLSIEAAVRLMLEEELETPRRLLEHKAGLAKATRMISKRLLAKGRLFYVGAGTSGRLGVLDASECPPTFRSDPEQVQGIIAGGQTALWRAVEGAEDNVEAGARAVIERGVSRGDVVVGIAASGRTPFVWGALGQAKELGAATILLSFNPHLKFARNGRPDLLLAIPVGPEVLTGSTRLKAGTATKLALNLFSTLSMVRLGKVASNLMIDLNASNSKLRERATRILMELSGRSREEAIGALEKNGWVIKHALKEFKAGPRKNQGTG